MATEWNIQGNFNSGTQGTVFVNLNITSNPDGSPTGLTGIVTRGRLPYSVTQVTVFGLPDVNYFYPTVSPSYFSTSGFLFNDGTYVYNINAPNTVLPPLISANFPTVDSQVNFNVTSVPTLTCICEGTFIKINFDEYIEIEKLKKGDNVLIAGNFHNFIFKEEFQKIKWIGKRIINNSAFCHYPIYYIDYNLYLSEGHRTILNGLRLNSSEHVNGQNVVKISEFNGPLTYYHIEFENHYMISATGFPKQGKDLLIESFIDCGGKNAFEELI